MRLTFFVRGALENPLNERWHWVTRYRWAKRWRMETRLAFMAAYPSSWVLAAARYSSHRLKRVVFTAHVVRGFDNHDNLRAALKPVLDELTRGNLRKPGLGIISGDSPDDGHEFDYYQIKGTGKRGVHVEIESRRF